MYILIKINNACCSNYIGISSITLIFNLFVSRRKNGELFEYHKLFSIESRPLDLNYLEIKVEMVEAQRWIQIETRILLR